jgi:hypothetical protein
MPGIPLLSEEQCAGRGKLNRGFHARLTSGTEAGELLADVELLHEIELPEDVAVVENYLPGASECYHRAFGDDSDGRRPLPWTPADGSCRLTIRDADTVTLYDGAATLRKVNLRIVSKACVLTISVRLDAFSSDQAQGFLDTMGNLVDYEVVFSRIEGATEEGGKAKEDGLPFDAPFAPGDLVMLAEGMGDPAVVVSLGNGRAILRRALVDSPAVVPFDVAVSDIADSMRICGPKGGKTADALARIAERVPRAKPEDVIMAVLSAQGTGDSVLVEEGWTITAAVIEQIEAIAGPGEPGPVTADNAPSLTELVDDDLPPEPA